MQNTTLSDDDRARLKMLESINLEAWEHTAAYFKAEIEKHEMVEELYRDGVDLARTQYLRGFLAATEAIINFPALVEAERESYETRE